MIESTEGVSLGTIASKEDCWIWATGCFSTGYGRLWIEGRSLYAHRVSFEMHHRPLLPGEMVCHRCDNPPCINPDHLFAGSCKDNLRDMVLKGRSNKASGDNHGLRKHPERVSRGDVHTNAKLKCADIPDIRRRLSLKEPHASIASLYGVSRETITRIKNGKVWTHIP